MNWMQNFEEVLSVVDSLNGNTGRKRTFITSGNSETCRGGIRTSSVKSIGTETKTKNSQFLKTILFKIQFLKALYNYLKGGGKICIVQLLTLSL